MDEMTEFTAEGDDVLSRSILLTQLVQMRYEKKLRQVDVAEAMGIGQPSVSEFERGETNPKLDTLQRYARAIGARIEFKVVEDGNE